MDNSKHGNRNSSVWRQKLVKCKVFEVHTVVKISMLLFWAERPVDTSLSEGNFFRELLHIH
jgi:hypothetical protein